LYPKPFAAFAQAPKDGVDEPDRLEKQALKVGEDRAIGVGLVVDLPPLAAIAENAGGDMPRGAGTIADPSDHAARSRPWTRLMRLNQVSREFELRMLGDATLDSP
jgi:hypothetical protein